MATHGRSNLVFMPWNENQDIIYNSQVFQRWNLVTHRLHSPISDVDELIDVIRSYNVLFSEDGSQTTPAWSFTALRELVDSMTPDDKNQFFSEDGVLQYMQSLALQMPQLCEEIQWLSQGNEASLTLHQMQIASILANAFFCTFTKRGKNKPSINFISLFQGGSRANRRSTHVEKLKCIVNYFWRIYKKQPNGFLSFHRRYTAQNDYPRWGQTRKELSDLTVDSEGFIEDQEGHLQMDFANRVIGGGVLGWGCVQEEIRFVICPELIAARLFTEPLLENEALIIIGAERYCNFTGYADSFEFTGDYVDTTPMDAHLRRKTHILAVDAISFDRPLDQYRESRMLRELKKMYTGLVPLPGEELLPLATGNWGCGAFGGDPKLKSLLQLMAASQVGQSVVYFTFGDEKLKEELECCHAQLKQRGTTVGQLYRILSRYIKERRRNQSVFSFVHYAPTQTSSSYALFNSSRGAPTTGGGSPSEEGDGALKRGNATGYASVDKSSKHAKRDDRPDKPWPKAWLEDERGKKTDSDLSRRFDTLLDASARPSKDSVRSEAGPSDRKSPILFTDPFNDDSEAMQDSDDMVPCTPEENFTSKQILSFYGSRGKPKTTATPSTSARSSNSVETKNTGKLGEKFFNVIGVPSTSARSNNSVDASHKKTQSQGKPGERSFIGSKEKLLVTISSSNRVKNNGNFSQKKSSSQETEAKSKYFNDISKVFGPSALDLKSGQISGVIVKRSKSQELPKKEKETRSRGDQMSLLDALDACESAKDKQILPKTLNYLKAIDKLSEADDGFRKLDALVPTSKSCTPVENSRAENIVLAPECTSPVEANGAEIGIGFNPEDEKMACSPMSSECSEFISATPTCVIYPTPVVTTATKTQKLALENKTPQRRLSQTTMDSFVKK